MAKKGSSKEPTAAQLQKEKMEKLAAVTGSIRKQFGEDTIKPLGGQGRLVPCLPSDYPSIDLRALRIGGLGKGVVVEVYGPPGGGKSTLALHFIAACQRRGGIVAYVDQEQSLNTSLATSVGCDLAEDRFLFSQPDDGEQGLSIVREWIRSGVADIIVFDSLAAVITRDSLDKDPSSTDAIASRARLVSQEYPKIISEANNAPNRPIVIFINQLRVKMNKLGPATMEPTCGNAPKFYSSVRIDVGYVKALREGGSDEERGQQYGHRTRIRVMKNKFAPPFHQAELNLIYGAGFDPYAEAIDVGVGADFIVQSGAWFDPSKYGLSKVQGALKLREQLVENNEAFLALRMDVVKHLKEEVKQGTPRPMEAPFQQAISAYDKEIMSE